MSAQDRARDLITFANGLEAAGQREYAQRARVVADDSLELARQLDAERSARKALQARCDELQELIGQHAYQATAALGDEDIAWPA